jgi:arylsulfatase A-like enzyme
MRIAWMTKVVAMAMIGASVLTMSAVGSSVAQVSPRAVAFGTPGSPPARVMGGVLPNTLIVMTDDMRLDEMRYLPRTRAWLSSRGVTFTNGYSPTPLCCPARASLLTGQYAHNTGVYTNQSGGDFPGGVSAFDDSRTIATVLNSELGDANIETGYIGKYLNGYKAGGGDVSGTYVPPGWDDWKASVAGEYQYNGVTTYSFDGRYVDIPGYETTVQTRLASKFIERNSGETPWMLLLNYFAPHNNVGPRVNIPVPEPAHAHDYDGAAAPRGQAYNERDVSDKPRAVRRPLMSEEVRDYTDRLTEGRYESLASVDDGMMRLRRALRAAGVSAQTNIIFLSDNGYLLGEHRIPHEKKYVYEPSATIPMYASGEGLLPGSQSNALAGVHDISSTVAGFYGLSSMPGGDGLSLRTVATGGANRRHILLRGSYGSEKDYTAIRAPGAWKYVEYASGGTELYNLRTDPAEVSNLSEQPAYAERRAKLAQRLAGLHDCAGNSCW